MNTEGEKIEEEQRRCDCNLTGGCLKCSRFDFQIRRLEDTDPFAFILKTEKGI